MDDINERRDELIKKREEIVAEAKRQAAIVKTTPLPSAHTRWAMARNIPSTRPTIKP